MNTEQIYNLIKECKEIEYQLTEIDRKQFGAEKALEKISETIEELLLIYGTISYNNRYLFQK